MTRIKVRRGTAAGWTAVDPVLAEGEPGYETDTRKLKFGDGTTRWSDLPYVVGGEIDGALIEDGTITTTKLDSGVDAAYAAAEHSHSADVLASGTIAAARLGSGTADGTTFLRGDSTWATPAGGSGGLSQSQVLARGLGA